ncbi:MAG: hypothetical protein EOO88_17195 [Pedobacter sp.]|nr:MAG: hypothetical protein EOO88_17195 [Pedobacter sp.]
MNKAILAEEVQSYINANLNSDVHRIAMARSPFSEVSSKELSGQIMAKKKSEKKLPTWFNQEQIYYPQLLSIEQCSSEKTADYKSTLISGGNLIDLTGGFGVDSFYFSKHADSVIHCELDPELSSIVAHNTGVLGVTNMRCEAVDGLKYLQDNIESFETIYVDPARRSTTGKVFMLKDCTPDVVTHLDLLLSKTQQLIIKTSPLLDISAGIKELKNVAEVRIISTKNECKELLFILKPGFIGEVAIVSVTLNKTIKEVSFTQHDTVATTFANAPLGQFLYEPDAALLKSGAFNQIAERYMLQKLDQHTQLYTADVVKPDFPGRIFFIDAVHTTQELKKEKSLQGNVIVRNYPEKPEILVKKFKIKPADSNFQIFTKTAKQGFIVISASILQHY